jgi:hypothetical protein
VFLVVASSEDGSSRPACVFYISNRLGWAYIGDYHILPTSSDLLYFQPVIMFAGVVYVFVVYKVENV